MPVVDSIGFAPAHNPHSMHAHILRVVTDLAWGEKQVRTAASTQVHTHLGAAVCGAGAMLALVHAICMVPILCGVSPWMQVVVHLASQTQSDRS